MADHTSGKGAKDTIRSHFDEYAGNWHERLRNHPFAMRYREVEAFAKRLDPKTVVDVGCGTGDYCRMFDPGRYIGFDLSPEMIKRSRALHPGYKFEVGDGDALNLPDSCAELVLDIAVIEYYQDPMPHIRELSRIAKRGGYLVIAVPNGSNVTRAMHRKFGEILSGIKQLLLPNTRDESTVRLGKTKDRRIKHRARTVQELRAFGSAAGLTLLDWKYVNLMLLPEVARFVAPINIAISQRLSGQRGWRWLSSWSGTILICLMRRSD